MLKFYLTILIFIERIFQSVSFENYRFVLNSKFLRPIKLSSNNDNFADLFPYTLEKFREVDDLNEVQSINPEYLNKIGVLANKTVEFECKLYESYYLSALRLVTFKGVGFNIFNLLAIPNLFGEHKNYPFPILGIDIVILPGSTLAAIDFQPSYQGEEFFNGPFYSKLRLKHEQWASKLPPGSTLPMVNLYCLSCK